MTEVIWDTNHKGQPAVTHVQDGTSRLFSLCGHAEGYRVNVDSYAAEHGMTETAVTLYRDGRRVPDNAKRDLRARILTAYGFVMVAEFGRTIDALEAVKPEHAGIPAHRRNHREHVWAVEEGGAYDLDATICATARVSKQLRLAERMARYDAQEAAERAEDLELLETLAAKRITAPCHITINGRPVCEHTACVAGMEDAAGVRAMSQHDTCEFQDVGYAQDARDAWETVKPGARVAIVNGPCPAMTAHELETARRELQDASKAVDSVGDLDGYDAAEERMEAALDRRDAALEAHVTRYQRAELDRLNAMGDSLFVGTPREAHKRLERAKRCERVLGLAAPRKYQGAWDADACDYVLSDTPPAGSPVTRVLFRAFDQEAGGWSIVDILELDADTAETLATLRAWFPRFEDVRTQYAVERGVWLESGRAWPTQGKARVTWSYWTPRLIPVERAERFDANAYVVQPGFPWLVMGGRIMLARYATEAEANAKAAEVSPGWREQFGIPAAVVYQSAAEAPVCHIIVGSSIDGIVYRDEHGWTPVKGLARSFLTREGAEGELAEQRAVNANLDADSIVGRLAILTYPRSDFAMMRVAAFDAMERETCEEYQDEPEPLVFSDPDWSVIDCALCLYAAGEDERAESARTRTEREDAKAQAKHARRIGDVIGKRARA